MAEKRSGRSAGIGGSLILIIFIVLTITVFSVLTLVSSQNEIGTVKKTAEVATAYYNAEKEAAVKTAEIKNAVSGIDDNQSIADISLEQGASASVTPEGVNITFKVKIDDNRSIETVLYAANGNIDVVSQKIVSDKEFIIDDDLPIWDGSSPII